MPHPYAVPVEQVLFVTLYFTSQDSAFKEDSFIFRETYISISIFRSQSKEAFSKFSSDTLVSLRSKNRSSSWPWKPQIKSKHLNIEFWKLRRVFRFHHFRRDAPNIGEQLKLQPMDSRTLVLLMFTRINMWSFTLPFNFTLANF